MGGVPSISLGHTGAPKRSSFATKMHHQQADVDYPDAGDGDSLAARANAVLENYKNKAMVLNTKSVPRTADQPAEHLIAVAFAQPTFIEMAFARFKIVDGVGCSAVYSHRIYGEKIGDAMSAWLRQTDPRPRRP